MDQSRYIKKLETKKNYASSKMPFFQPKLSVNQPDDIYEQEADQTADKVMRMSAPNLIKQPFFKPAEKVTDRNSGTNKAVAAKNLPGSNMVLRQKQEPTLTESKGDALNLPRQSLSRMDAQKQADMPDDDRKKWYVEKLGPYENQLHESADRNLVPVQLLAVVILNELADIDYKDQLQSDLAVYKGSLGIAQIQIDTAINDKLFDDITAEEGKRAYQEMVINTQPTGTGKLAARIIESDDKDKRMAVNKRLQIPQYAIEAAAKEIRILLNAMMNNTGADWQKRYGFVHKGIAVPRNAQAIYDDVAGATQLEKESNLAKLITGAYNSPGIIKAANSSEDIFPNANIHGENSRSIAGDLKVFNLFRP